LPASQFTQSVALVLSSEPEYLPAAQSSQALLLVCASEPEYLPATQLVHSAVPVGILYFPATHRAHAEPSAPVAPALQVQSPSASLAAGALELAGQF
jgi:hypothetical protein